MTFKTFIQIAKRARQSRCETTVMALCEAYEAMGGALYPQDTALIMDVFGGPPVDWEWAPYFGPGGYTNLRRLPVWEMPDHSQTADSIDEMFAEIGE